MGLTGGAAAAVFIYIYSFQLQRLIHTVCFHCRLFKHLCKKTKKKKWKKKKASGNKFLLSYWELDGDKLIRENRHFPNSSPSFLRHTAGWLVVWLAGCLVVHVEPT